MTTLRGITWDHTRGRGPLEATAGEYECLTGVRVEWEARSLKDFGDAPPEPLAGAYDLIIMDHPHVGMGATSDCLSPADEHLDRDTLSRLETESAGPSHRSYTYAGHQWALAIDAAMQTSVRAGALRDEPEPRTWDDALALAQELRDDGRWMAMPLAPTDAVCAFLSICAGLGEAPGRGAQFVSRPVGLRALGILGQAARLAHPSSLDRNPIAMLDLMRNTEEGIVYAPMSFCYTNYSRPGLGERRLRFGAVPGVRGSILGGAGFAVSARCADPGAAWAYGAWLCGAEVQRTSYVEHGGQPGNASAWRDADADRAVGGFFSDTLETLELSHVRPRSPGWPPFQEHAGRVINAVLREHEDGELCLDELQRLYESHEAREAPGDAPQPQKGGAA